MAVNLGEAVVATARRYLPTMTDNITADNGLLQFLRDKGKIEVYRGGGRQIAEPLLFNESGNSSVNWFEGYETFTPQTSWDVIDAATFDWRQMAGLITISTREEKINRGEQEQVSLIESRIDATEAIMANQLAAALYNTGTNAKAIAGLGHLVQDDPTTSSTVGGIQQSSVTWWRNYYSAAASTTKSNIISRLNAAWLGIKRGKDMPDLYVADSYMYDMYEQALQDLQRITTADSADAGYGSLRYKGKPFLFDDVCTTKRIYCLNTNHLRLRKVDEEMFEVGDPRVVANAFYKVIPISMMGQMTTRRRASHGVIIAS